MLTLKMKAMGGKKTGIYQCFLSFGACMLRVKVSQLSAQEEHVQ